jgi:toxin ParE1/3/4
VTCRIRFHSRIARDLDAIVQWIVDCAGPEIAARKPDGIEAAIATPRDSPHKGSVRTGIVPGLCAIPVERRVILDGP